MIYEALKEVSEKELNSIIDRREPAGRFYCKKGWTWVAVDNEYGEAWTEDFPSLDAAMAWLAGDGEADDYRKQVIIKPIEALRAINQKAKRKAEEVIIVMKPAKRNNEIEAARKWLNGAEERTERRCWWPSKSTASTYDGRARE